MKKISIQDLKAQLSVVTDREMDRPAKLQRFYVDTSAYLCMLLREHGSDALVKQLGLPL